MPVKKPMMAAMKKHYGAKKGKAVYYATEQKAKRKMRAKRSLMRK